MKSVRTGILKFSLTWFNVCEKQTMSTRDGILYDIYLQEMGNHSYITWVCNIYTQMTKGSQGNKGMYIGRYCTKSNVGRFKTK